MSHLLYPRRSEVANRNGYQRVINPRRRGARKTHLSHLVYSSECVGRLIRFTSRGPITGISFLAVAEGMVPMGVVRNTFTCALGFDL